MIPAAVGFSCCTDGGFPFCRHIKERRVNYEWNRDVENMSKRKVSTNVPWENSHVMHSHWNANLQPLNCYDWLKTFINTWTQHSCIEHFETITWLHLNTIGSLNICRMNISLVSLSLYQVRCATTSKSKRELHGSMQRTPHIKCQRHRE